MKHIDNFLPVKEPAGRPVDLEVLRRFGLVENEKLDHFFASAFVKTKGSNEIDRPGSEPKHAKPPPKLSTSDHPAQNE